MASRSNFATRGSLVQDVNAVVDRLLAAAREADMAEPERSLLGCARRVYAERRLRSELFDAALSLDPAWDILLTLLIARLEGRSTSVSAACTGAHAPTTTALRHIERLERQGLVRRRPNPSDARSHYLVLTGEAERKLEDYFAALQDLK